MQIPTNCLLCNKILTSRQYYNTYHSCLHNDGSYCDIIEYKDIIDKIRITIKYNNIMVLWDFSTKTIFYQSSTLPWIEPNLNNIQESINRLKLLSIFS